MPILFDKLWQAVASLVRQGYSPIPEPASEARWWLSSGIGLTATSPDDLRNRYRTTVEEGVAVILPTSLQRSAGLLAERVHRLTDQLSSLQGGGESVVAILMVGLQWYDDDEDEAIRELEMAMGTAASGKSGVPVVGLTLEGPRKVRTLSVGIEVALQLSVRGVGWIDDDVTLETECLRQLVAAFYQAPMPCVAGVTKVPHSQPDRASRTLFAIKELIQPATNYPHGCGMLVERGLLANGIPMRYDSDDGYFCFEVLRRFCRAPQERLFLVPAARCHYSVGVERGRLLARLRRLLLHQVIFLADYPPATGVRYLGAYLYPGFWPLSATRAHRQGGVLEVASRWLLQAVHLTGVLSLVLELSVRGMLGRPLRSVRWS